MKHRMLLVPAVAAAVLALVACSNPASGNPTPSTGGDSKPATSAGIPSGGSGSGDPLASVDPCSLIGPSVISKNQLQQQATPSVPGGRGCRWQRLDTGANLDGYEVDVDIYDTSGLSGMNTNGMTVSDYPVGNHQGKLLQDTAVGSCVLGIGVTSTSRVDIDANATGGDINTSCALVKQIAPAVQPNLPAASG